MAYTEWTFQGRVLSWIREFIKEKNLPFDGADQEVIIEGRKRPDILIWKNRNLREAALLLSLKGPYSDAWEAADDALIASSRIGTRYFATWNVNRFFMWDRYRRGTLYDQLVDASEVTTIKKWREIDRAEESIKSFLRDFLIEFTEVYYERKPIPPLPPDERFIYRLRSAIDAFSIPAFDQIKYEWRRSNEFKEGLRKWFAEQGWTFTRTDEDFEKVARQYVYLLVNKIIFYYILRLKNSQLLKIQVPLGVPGEQFGEILQSFFNQALRIDYETIFAADFLDTIPLPDELTGQLRNFLDRVGEYDFSKVGYEVIGRVFERLIPERERHKLGQYFTRSDVVDLIAGFCVRSSEDDVLDPACGAGTFLVRSYARKKFLDPHKPHEQILKELYGIDIAKFPAHLTTINLAARDLSVEENYPRVLCEDFFDVIGEKRIPILKKEYMEKYRAEGLDLKKLMVEIPLCDAVIMNPPYTRREEMEDLLPKGYTERLQNLVKEDWDISVGKWLSIYGYFFLHGGKFVKEGKKLGLITSNSWLDVDYGKYLQEYFLKNFKLLTVIESKVERWFEEADINTCITILEKCSIAKDRDNNFVNFVQLKRPLGEFLAQTNNEIKRWKAVDKFVRFLEKIDEPYENDMMKVYPITQGRLWEEGFDLKNRKYEGSKWSKYLRAPNIIFNIFDKHQNQFVTLKEIAKVELGITTGFNPFFYLNPKDVRQWELEPEFLKPLIKSPRECKSIFVKPADLKLQVLVVTEEKRKLRGTKVLRYIDWGEKEGIPRRPFFKSKTKEWYKLYADKTPPILVPNLFWRRHAAFYNESKCCVDKKLIGITSHDESLGKSICAILNSSLMSLIIEMSGRRTLGQGALDISTGDYEKLWIVDPRKLSKETLKELEEKLVRLSKRPVRDIFEEIGTGTPETMQLDRVKPDRRDLDKVVFNILGLTEEQQLEVYKALIDLVKSRIEMARSVKKRRKKIRGIDVDALVQDIFEEVGKGKLMNFPDDYTEGVDCSEISVPKGEAEVGRDLRGFYVKIDGNTIRCKSPYEAKYIQYAVLNGKTTIKIFKDEKLIERAVRDYGSFLREVKKRINEYVESTIPDRKLRKRIKDDVWKKLTGQK